MNVLIFDDATAHKGYKEHLRKEKIDTAIFGLSVAAGCSMRQAADAIRELSNVGIKASESIEALSKAMRNLNLKETSMWVDNQMAQDTGIDFWRMLEEQKEAERIAQQENKAYCKQLLLDMSYVHDRSVKENVAYVPEYHRRCDMQLKTFHNLRF